MMAAVNGPSAALQNSMARGAGSPYNRTMNMNNAAPAIQFPTSMPNLQEQLQTQNFLAHQGMNGTPEQSRPLSSSQVNLLLLRLPPKQYALMWGFSGLPSFER